MRKSLTALDSAIIAIKIGAFVVGALAVIAISRLQRGPFRVVGSTK